MSGRHWSIGEVLNLLNDEFPDVTISKIRFLESQGLIDPERTPSGYRRFYRDDLDRLRWILAQQRDHYLPLKVIKARLDSGEVTSFEIAPVSPTVEPEAAGVDTSPDAPATTASSVAAEPTADLTPDDTDRRAVEHDAVESVTVDSDAVDSGIDDDGIDDAGTVDLDDDAGEAAEADDRPVDWPGDERLRTPVEQETVVRAEPDRVEPDVTDPSVADDAASITTSDDLVMTREDLATAAGVEISTVRELERAGLLTGRSAGQAMLFGADALDVLRVVGRLGELGLDPRHLRPFRLSVDREVGLFEQLAGPALSKRDAASRVEGRAMVAELREQSDELRRLLMDRAVNTLIPPG